MLFDAGKRIGLKEGKRRVCSYCLTAFVAENYAICLSESLFVLRARLSALV